MKMKYLQEICKKFSRISSNLVPHTSNLFSMQKIFNYLMIMALIAILSCQEEELKGIPALPPRITINAPGAVVANLGADLSAMVTDGANSPVSSVTFDLIEESGTSVGSKTFSEALVAGPNSLTWTAEESGIAALAAGNYKLKITATDTEAKESINEADLKILALNPECLTEGQVTIVLLAPDPAEGMTIGFVGSPTNWGASTGTDIVMNKVTNGVYCGSVAMQAGAEYKFRLNENWSTQEGKLDGSCSDGSNRIYSGSGSDLIVQQVPVWKPCN